MKRQIFELRYNKVTGEWFLYKGKDYAFAGRLKTDAVSYARAVASARGNQPSQLIIKKRNGQIQEERTYPRSSDPRKTVGGNNGSL